MAFASKATKMFLAKQNGVAIIPAQEAIDQRFKTTGFAEAVII